MSVDIIAGRQKSRGTKEGGGGGTAPLLMVPVSIKSSSFIIYLSFYTYQVGLSLMS